MEPFDLRITDLAQYRTMPLLTTTGTVSLSRSVLDLSPPQLPDYVESSKKRLFIAIEATESAVTSRLDVKFSLSSERSFDILVDHVWVGLRSRLAYWGLYTHEGVALFSEAEREELDLDEGVVLAATAAKLINRLFGDGVEFLRLSYPEQAEHMAARLRYIEREGLSDAFEELVGHRPALLVRVCQRRYDAMVRDRHGREAGVSVNLRLLRDQLRRATEDYASLLLSTIHDASDEWVAQVFASLKPMVLARSPGRRGAAELESEDEVDAAEIEAVEADEADEVVEEDELIAP